MKKPQPYQDAIQALDLEIARCESHSEYSERCKVEGYLRAKQFLIEKRKQVEKERLNGAQNGAGK